MTAVAANHAQLEAGPGWAAQIYLERIYLATDPALEALSDALAALFSPSQRRYWTVEWDHHDQQGWDVYVLLRDHGPLLV